MRGNIEAKESGFTRVVKAWASDVINFVNIYHTGTGAGTGYGIIESTTGFVLAAGATFSTAITGTATYQAIVQYAGGAYNSIRFGHNDTDGEINTTAGKLKLNPFGIVEILKNVLISGTDARIEMKGVTNDPAVPATGNLHFFAKDIAGRMYPRVLTPTGFDTTLQASSMFNTFQKIQPGSGTAFYVEGNSITSVGTISHPAQADTNLKTRNRRAVNTSVATAGGLASTRVNSAEFSRNTGFSVVIRFSLDTLAAGMRSFV